MRKIFSFQKLFYFFGILAVILLLIFFNSRGWLSAPKKVIYWGASPFLKFFYASEQRVNEGIRFIFTIKDLALDNARLADENKKLWDENAGLKESARENEALRRRLELPLPAGSKQVLADVVGYDSQSGQYLLINKGSADGIAVNSPAVDANNFLIGRIAEVAGNFSKIMLLADSNSAINAITQDTRVNGLAKGSHGLGLMLEMIPVDAQINGGETVLTSGINDSLTQGLVIGHVGRIIQKENEIFQKAEIELAVNPRRVEKVFVIIK